MYKITLYDQKCSPICDGTTFWFVEDLEKFEKNWIPLQCRIGVEVVERYYRSKFGEVVTDYYSTDPSLNIVQSVECEILEEKVFEYKDKEVELINTYDFGSKILFDKLKIVLRGNPCQKDLEGYERLARAQYAQFY